MSPFAQSFHSVQAFLLFFYEGLWDLTLNVTHLHGLIDFAYQLCKRVKLICDLHSLDVKQPPYWGNPLTHFPLPVRGVLYIYLKDMDRSTAAGEEKQMGNNKLDLKERKNKKSKLDVQVPFINVSKKSDSSTSITRIIRIIRQVGPCCIKHQLFLSLED